MGHCACVVETDLATQHLSGKSEGCAKHIASMQSTLLLWGLGAPPQKTFKIASSENESEGIFKNI